MAATFVLVLGAGLASAANSRVEAGHGGRHQDGAFGAMRSGTGGRCWPKAWNYPGPAVARWKLSKASRSGHSYREA
jgi:hypothetical protein